MSDIHHSTDRAIGMVKVLLGESRAFCACECGTSALRICRCQRIILKTIASRFFQMVENTGFSGELVSEDSSNRAFVGVEGSAPDLLRLGNTPLSVASDSEIRLVQNSIVRQDAAFQSCVALEVRGVSGRLRSGRR